MSRHRERWVKADAIGAARAILSAMTGRGFSVLTVTVLVAWVLLGPIAMAFTPCDEMCEGPCGALTYGLPAPVTITTPESAGDSHVPSVPHPLTRIVTPPEQPPKLVPPFA
jgi:hypothetical protein